MLDASVGAVELLLFEPPHDDANIPITHSTARTRIVIPSFLGETSCAESMPVWRDWEKTEPVTSPHLSVNICEQEQSRQHLPPPTQQPERCGPFKYLDQFRVYEREAREAGRGLWAGELPAPPSVVADVPYCTPGRTITEQPIV